MLVLAAGIASGGVLPLSLLGSQPIATVAFIGGVVLLAAALIWLTVVRAKRDERRAVAEASGLKRSLAAADSLSAPSRRSCCSGSRTSPCASSPIR